LLQKGAAADSNSSEEKKMKIIKKGEDEAEKEAMRSRQLQRSTPPGKEF